MNNGSLFKTLSVLGSLAVFTGCESITGSSSAEFDCRIRCTAVLESYAGRSLPTRVRDNNTTPRTMETAADTLTVNDTTYQMNTVYVIRFQIASAYFSLSGDGQVERNGDSIFFFQGGEIVKRGVAYGNILSLLDKTDTLATYRIIAF